jgi:hypothetical protein
MARKHLDTARLLSLHRGDLGDFAALEHLASCADCQKAFDDSRWLMLLERLPELVKAGPHPGKDVIAAYRSQALSSKRLAEVERHLRSCDSCLAVYGRMRVAEQATAYLSPAPASVRRVLKRFRPRRLRRLGTVFVTGLDKGLVRLVFAPGPSRLEDAGLAQLDFMPMEETRAARQAHPASAKERVRRLVREFGAADLEDGIAEAAAPAMREPTEDDRVAGETMELQQAALGPVETGEVHIPVDGLHLILTPRIEDEQRRLRVQLVSRDDDRSFAGVIVRIRGPRGREDQVATDGSGRVVLPFHPGVTELVVEIDPPLALALDFPD